MRATSGNYCCCCRLADRQLLYVKCDLPGERSSLTHVPAAPCVCDPSSAGSKIDIPCQMSIPLKDCQEVVLQIQPECRELAG